MRHFDSVIAICVTVVILAIAGMIYQDCRETENYRAECVKAGKSAEDCRRLFPAAGDRR